MLVLFQLLSVTEVRSCGVEERRMVPVPATTQVLSHSYDSSSALNICHIVLLEDYLGTE